MTLWLQAPLTNPLHQLPIEQSLLTECPTPTRSLATALANSEAQVTVIPAAGLLLSPTQQLGEYVHTLTMRSSHTLHPMTSGVCC
jgi:hypothetical protein